MLDALEKFCMESFHSLNFTMNGLMHAKLRYHYMEERVKKGDCQKSYTLTGGTKKCTTLDFYLILFNFVCSGSKILGHGTTELNLNSQPLWIHSDGRINRAC